MPVQLGQPAHGFDQPIDLMCDCHRRIEHFLEILCLVTETAGSPDTGGRPLSASHRHALETALEYFTHRVSRHRQDEEESLFPRLAQSPDPRAKDLQATLQELLADHRASDEHHATSNALLRQWLDADRLSPADYARLAASLDWLAAMYRRHIRLEGACVFAAARACLPQDQLTQVGHEMAHRRQITHPKESKDF